MPPKKKKELTFLQKALVTSVIIFLILVVPKRQDNRVIGNQPTNAQQRAQETTKAQQMLNDSPIIEPVKSITKIGVGIIENMGDQMMKNAQNQAKVNKIRMKEAYTAARNHRKPKDVLADDTIDMPPWEHPHRWGKISSEHGTCWYHNDTMRKVCQ